MEACGFASADGERRDNDSSDRAARAFQAKSRAIVLCVLFVHLPPQPGEKKRPPPSGGERPSVAERRHPLFSSAKLKQPMQVIPGAGFPTNLQGSIRPVVALPDPDRAASTPIHEALALPGKIPLVLLHQAPEVVNLIGVQEARLADTAP
jgi:hypothetical protein